MDLELGDGSYDVAAAQTALRLCAQAIYVVVNIYFSSQHAVFYCARFSSRPTELYHQCLLHWLRYAYAARHMGLALGAVDGDDDVLVGGLLAGGHADAGHAQPGPSTGGTSLDIGKVTVHAVSGQHHATTLGTTDAETYEVSQAVAGVVALRMFCSELGFPQLTPSVLRCDNSGTVAKAAAAASDKRSLYMKRRITFVQEAQAFDECSVQYIPSAQNRADILTKVLKMPLFGAMRAMLHNITSSVMDLVARISGDGAR